MRPAIVYLICAVLLTPACEKKEEAPPAKPGEEAAAVEAAPGKAAQEAGKPAPKKKEKETIQADMTCPPGTEVRHSAWKDHGSKWCVRPDGKQHGMTVKMYTNPQAKWPFEMTGNWKEGERDGTWTWWYDDGTKKKEGQFQNGKESGPWFEWHPNKNKAVESSYQDGELDGVWKKWAFQGGLVEEGKYDKGKVVGTWTFWNQAGKELGKNELGEAGTGPWKRWSALGTLLEEGAYQDGLREGHWVVYFGRGDKKKEEGDYLQGKKVGKWTEYRGVMDDYQEGSYKDGQRTGKWLGWATMPVPGKPGKKKKVKTKEEFYKDGRLHGKITRWQYGKLSSVEQYKDGRLHGKSLHYSFGKRQWQDTYVNGRKEGKHISWESDGKRVWKQGQFKAGKPCGKWKCQYRGRKTKCPAERQNLPKCK